MATARSGRSGPDPGQASPLSLLSRLRLRTGGSTDFHRAYRLLERQIVGTEGECVLYNGGNPLGCRGCHAGTEDLSGLPESNGAPGNIHGGSFTWPGSSASPYVRSRYFLYGGWLSGWVDGTCWGGTRHHSGEGESY